MLPLGKEQGQRRHVASNMWRQGQPIVCRRTAGAPRHPTKKCAHAGQQGQAGCVQAPQSPLVQLQGNRGTSRSTADPFFLTRAPCSALAAVGRGASGEKDMSLVRTTDMLYNAKVKPYGLRSGTQRRRKGWGWRWLPCEHAKGATSGASRCRAVPPCRRHELRNAGSQNWSAVATQATVQHGLEDEAIM